MTGKYLPRGGGVFSVVLLRRVGGQADMDGEAAANIVCFDAAAHLFHKGPGDGQPQSRGAAAGLYGEEAVEEPAYLDLAELRGGVGKEAVPHWRTGGCYALSEQQKEKESKMRDSRDDCIFHFLNGQNKSDCRRNRQPDFSYFFSEGARLHPTYG